jgi:hypothetical protein
MLQLKDSDEKMSRIYTDFVSKSTLTLPDTFIDVKTGDTLTVPSKVQDQIDYHTKNGTLIHLILSAVNAYIKPSRNQETNATILAELAELKKMIQHSRLNIAPISNTEIQHYNGNHEHNETELKDIEAVLDAFGG